MESCSVFSGCLWIQSLCPAPVPVSPAPSSPCPSSLPPGFHKCQCYSVLCDCSDPPAITAAITSLQSNNNKAGVNITVALQ